MRPGRTCPKSATRRQSVGPVGGLLGLSRGGLLLRAILLLSRLVLLVGLISRLSSGLVLLLLLISRLLLILLPCGRRL